MLTSNQKILSNNSKLSKRLPKGKLLTPCKKPPRSYTQTVKCKPTPSCSGICWQDEWLGTAHLTVSSQTVSPWLSSIRSSTPPCKASRVSGHSECTPVSHQTDHQRRCFPPRMSECSKDIKWHSQLLCTRRRLLASPAGGGIEGQGEEVTGVIFHSYYHGKSHGETKKLNTAGPQEIQTALEDPAFATEFSYCSVVHTGKNLCAFEWMYFSVLLPGFTFNTTTDVQRSRRLTVLIICSHFVIRSSNFLCWHVLS